MIQRFDRIVAGSHYLPPYMVWARNGQYVSAVAYFALAHEALAVVRALLVELELLMSRESVH